LQKKSIYEIAKQTGVSPTTVSRVLNNHPNVSAATRQTVLKAINSANYVPTISKSAFENIGVFIGTYDTDRYSVSLSPYCSEVVNGLSSIFCKYGYSLSLFPVNAVPRDRDDFKIFCFRRHIGAAVFLNVSLQDTFITDFAGLLPIVCIGTEMDSDKIKYVKCDHNAVSAEAVELLYQQGHRNLALLNVAFNIQDHMERYQAIESTCQRLGMTLSKENILIQSTSNYEDLPYLLENMIRRGVTALLCFDNQFSMRILHLLRTMDIRVPEDVSLIGYDDYSFAQYCSPPLTAIRQPIFNLGAYAGQHIINQLRDETTPCNLSLEPQLIVRKSVGPAKQG